MNLSIIIYMSWRVNSFLDLTPKASGAIDFRGLDIPWRELFKIYDDIVPLLRSWRRPRGWNVEQIECFKAGNLELVTWPSRIQIYIYIRPLCSPNNRITHKVFQCVFNQMQSWLHAASIYWKQLFSTFVEKGEFQRSKSKWRVHVFTDLHKWTS